MTDDFVDLPDDLDDMPAASADAPSPPHGRAASTAGKQRGEQERAKTGASEERPKMLGGVTGKGFVPNHPPTPNRRQKGLASLIRWQTDEGRRLVALMWRIARGGKFSVSTVTKLGLVECRVRPSVRDRMDAAAWLADRGWGKVKDVIKLQGEEGRRPVNIVFLGGPRADPLGSERQPPMRRLPAPPVIAEVEFELQDVELPPPSTA